MRSQGQSKKVGGVVVLEFRQAWFGLVEVIVYRFQLSLSVCPKQSPNGESQRLEVCLSWGKGCFFWSQVGKK